MRNLNPLLLAFLTFGAIQMQAADFACRGKFKRVGKIQKGPESLSALALSKTPDPFEFAAAATLQAPAKLPLLLGDGKGGMWWASGKTFTI